MRDEILLKNTARYLLGTYVMGWTVFGIVWSAGYLGVLSPDSPPGSIVLLCAMISPMLMTYCMWKMTGEIETGIDFCRRLVRTKHVGNDIIWTIAFLVVHFVLVFVPNRAMFFGSRCEVWQVVLLLILAICEEIGWREYLAQTLERLMPFGYAIVITGVLWTLWYLPLYFVFGGVWTREERVLFLLLQVFLSIALSALRAATGNILPCICFRMLAGILILLLNGTFFRGSPFTIAYITEIILFFIIRNKYVDRRHMS